jgi:hypothetical protein
MRSGDSVGETIMYVAVPRAAQRHLHADPHSQTRSRARLNCALRGTSADLIPQPLREVFELQRSSHKFPSLSGPSKTWFPCHSASHEPVLTREGDYHSVLPGSSLTCFVSQNHPRHPTSKSSVDYINSLSNYIISLIMRHLPQTTMSK